MLCACSTPFIFKTIWNVISPLLEERTRKKIRVMGWVCSANASHSSCDTMLLLLYYLCCDDHNLCGTMLMLLNHLCCDDHRWLPKIFMMWCEIMELEVLLHACHGWFDSVPSCGTMMSTEFCVVRPSLIYLNNTLTITQVRYNRKEKTQPMPSRALLLIGRVMSWKNPSSFHYVLRADSNTLLSNHHCSSKHSYFDTSPTM